MSVMCENEHGWILDHSVYWNMSGQGGLGTHTNPVEMFNGDCRQGDKPMVKSSTAGIQTDSARVLHRKGHFNVKTDLFSIFRPFQMDSHFPKYAAKLTSEKSVHQTSSVHQSTAASRRKRKRKKPEEEINPGVIELGCRLMKAHESLVRLGLNLGHFTNTSDLPLNNNTAAREAARCDDWEMGGDVPTDHGQINTQTRTTLTQVEDGKAYTLEALSHTLYSWKGDSPAMISCLHGDCPSLLADQGESPDGMQVDQYLIPPSSTFFMSQADSLHAFVSALDGRLFDLIVADPPWENKSVKRKKTYSMLAEWELKRLPICQLARPGCVVAVWVTSKHRQIEFVRASLFPQWSVRYLAHWHWVKVTLGGEPVTDIMSQGKKPYESLLLGRYLPQCDKLEVGPENNRPQCDKREAGPQNNRPQCDNIVPGPQNYRPQGDKTEAGPQNNRPQCDNIVRGPQNYRPQGDKTEAGPQCDNIVPGLQNNRPRDPPVNKVIVSVPCILHSKKPPMYELLKQYCQSEPDCLELFARNLQPGWTSWGNEVIRHQNLKFYTSQEERT